MPMSHTHQKPMAMTYYIVHHHINLLNSNNNSNSRYQFHFFLIMIIIMLLHHRHHRIIHMMIECLRLIDMNVESNIHIIHIIEIMNKIIKMGNNETEIIIINVEVEEVIIIIIIITIVRESLCVRPQQKKRFSPIRRYLIYVHMDLFVSFFCFVKKFPFFFVERFELTN